MKRLCGAKDQHFISSVHSDGSFFRVTFRSNDVYETTGFQAAYQFTTFQGQCTPRPACWPAKPKPSYAPANMATT